MIQIQNAKFELPPLLFWDVQPTIHTYTDTQTHWQTHRLTTKNLIFGFSGSRIVELQQFWKFDLETIFTLPCMGKESKIYIYIYIYIPIYLLRINSNWPNPFKRLGNFPRKKKKEILSFNGLNTEKM